MQNKFWKSFICVRCGYCCKKATCTTGLHYGADPQNCKFLNKDENGSYNCNLIVEKVHPDIKKFLGINEGCCEPLNTDRMSILVGIDLIKD